MPKLTQDEKTLTGATLAANNTVRGTESHIKTVSQFFLKILCSDIYIYGIFVSQCI